MLETHLGGRFFCQEGEESTVCFMWCLSTALPAERDPFSVTVAFHYNRLSFNTALPVLPTSLWGVCSPLKSVKFPWLWVMPGAQILHSSLPPLKHKHPQLLVSSPKRFWHLVPRSTPIDLHFCSPNVILFNFFHCKDWKGWWKCFLHAGSVCGKHFESEFQQMNSTGLCMVEEKKISNTFWYLCIFKNISSNGY